MVSRRAVLLALLGAILALLAGCAGRGEVKPNIWMSLTPAERAEADRLEQAMVKVGQECQRYGRSCLAPPVTVGFANGTAHYHGGVISVPRARLINHPVMHAILSHELAHAYFPDARDDCGTKEKAFLCEQAANRHGVWVLMVGYGYTRDVAIRAMRAYLVAAVIEKVKPSWGHPDACAETHALELWARLPTYDCREK